MFFKTYQQRAEQLVEDIQDLKDDMQREQESLSSRITEIHQAKVNLDAALKLL